MRDIREFGMSVACAACAATFGLMGYIFKADSDKFIETLDKIEHSSGYTAEEIENIRGQHYKGILIDKVFEYGSYGAAGLAGLVGITVLPWKKKKLEDKLEE